MTNDPSLKSSMQGRWYEPQDQAESIWSEIIYITAAGDKKHMYTKDGERREETVHSGGVVEVKSERGHHFVGSPGHSVNYAKGGSGKTSDGSTECKSGGFSRTQSKQEDYTCTPGDKSSCCGGDRAEVVMGTLGIAATKNIYLGAGTTIAINATGDLEIKAKNINLLTPGGTVSINGSRMFGTQGGTGGNQGGSGGGGSQVA